jgi:putative membrane protein
MSIFALKGLHLIGMVTWFAGLFYLVRLLVYHVEAKAKPEPESGILQNQFSIMERRLYYAINIPSMIITLVFGTWMLIQNPGYLQEPWMHIKLAFVLLLVGYHHMIAALMKKAWKGQLAWTSKKLRILNEVATLFLIAIVLLATVGRYEGIAAWGMMVLSLVLIIVVMFYIFSKRSKKV